MPFEIMLANQEITINQEDALDIENALGLRDLNNQDYQDYIRRYPLGTVVNLAYYKTIQPTDTQKKRYNNICNQVFNYCAMNKDSIMNAGRITRQTFKYMLEFTTLDGLQQINPDLMEKLGVDSSNADLAASMVSAINYLKIVLDNKVNAADKEKYFSAIFKKFKEISFLENKGNQGDAEEPEIENARKLFKFFEDTIKAAFESKDQSLKNSALDKLTKLLVASPSAIENGRRIRRIQKLIRTDETINTDENHHLFIDKIVENSLLIHVDLGLRDIVKQDFLFSEYLLERLERRENFSRDLKQGFDILYSLGDEVKATIKYSKENWDFWNASLPNFKGVPLSGFTKHAATGALFFLWNCAEIILPRILPAVCISNPVVFTLGGVIIGSGQWSRIKYIWKGWGQKVDFYDQLNDACTKSYPEMALRFVTEHEQTITNQGNIKKLLGDFLDKEIDKINKNEKLEELCPLIPIEPILLKNKNFDGQFTSFLLTRERVKNNAILLSKAEIASVYETEFRKAFNNYKGDLPTSANNDIKKLQAINRR